MQNICKRQVIQTAHHAAAFYVGLFPLTDIFQYTNHLAVSCFEYSGYSLLRSQLTVRPRSSSQGLWRQFEQCFVWNISEFELLWYKSIFLISFVEKEFGLSPAALQWSTKKYVGIFCLLNNWNLFSVQCCFLVLCVSKMFSIQ